jgi:hypothetical protein
LGGDPYTTIACVGFKKMANNNNIKPNELDFIPPLKMGSRYHGVFSKTYDTYKIVCFTCYGSKDCDQTWYIPAAGVISIQTNTNKHW